MISYSIKLINEKYVKIAFKKVPSNLCVMFSNIFRRVLLSSMEGSCVYYFKIDGLVHNYCCIDGVLEDALEFSLNIKKIVCNIKYHRKLKVKVFKIGPCYLYAGDFAVPGFCKIANPLLRICRINDGFNFELEIGIKKGVGYLSNINENKSVSNIKKIYLDNSFSPVSKVKYKLSKKKEYSIVVFYVGTNGSVCIFDLIKNALSYLDSLFSFNEA